MQRELQKENEVRKDMMGLRVARGESICVVSDSTKHLETLLNELEERANQSRQVTGKYVHRGLYITGQEEMLASALDDEQRLVGFLDTINPVRLQEYMALSPSMTCVFVFRDGECVKLVERRMLLPNEDSQSDTEEDSFMLTEEETRMFVATSVKTGGSVILIADKVASTHDLVGGILSQEYFTEDALFGEEHILRTLKDQYKLKNVLHANKKSMKDTGTSLMYVREEKPVHMLNAKVECLAVLLDMNNVLDGGSLITMSKREFTRMQELSVAEMTRVSEEPNLEIPPWVTGLVSALLVGIGSDGKITSITTITEEAQG